MNTDQKQRKNKLLKLKCSVHNYDWGLPASASRVASLYALNNPGASIEYDKPYAELWMGTHDSGPSYLKNESLPTTLKSWISRNPSVLGDKVLDTWGPDLPFLFKVLSVGKALSIQAHPDKELATSLHKKNPNVYKDANHKPEMALAITEFEALCGFVSIQELQDIISSFPEVIDLIGDSNAYRVLHFNVKNGQQKFKPLLKEVFTQLMSADKNTVEEVVYTVKNRLQSETQVRDLSEKERLVLRLEKQYPGDVGVVSALFLNYIKLKPGEALYLGANEPHAYLFGDCIECMATSDNVVRAGLTPKLRDVQTLCSMLVYKQGKPEILEGILTNSYTKKYIPPFDEFEVDKCLLPQGASTTFSAVPGPSIFLVVSGRGIAETDSFEEEIAEGDVLFTPADCDVLFRAENQLEIYRAGVSSRFLVPSAT